MTDFLRNLQLNKWYKALVYVGVIGFVIALTLPIETELINNDMLVLLSLGFFAYGLGHWRGWKSNGIFRWYGPTDWDHLLQAVGIILVILSILWGMARGIILFHSWAF